MARLIKWVFVLIFLIGVLLGILTTNSIEDKAIVEPPEQLSSQEIKRVQHFIKTNNPLNVASGELVDKQISEDDLRVLLNYITLKTATGISRQLRVKVTLEEQLAHVQLTALLEKNPLGEYLNIQAELVEDVDTIVKLKSLKIGRVDVPIIITRLFPNMLNESLQSHLPEYRVIKDSVKQLNFTKEMMAVSYVWSSQADRMIKTQIGLRMLSDEQKHVLIDYTNYLANESHRLPEKTTLNYMINTMFKYARQRNEEQGHSLNPINENKAVFIALGAYILKRDIHEMLGEKNLRQSIEESSGIKATKYRRVYLNGRHDLSKHFILSAAITSIADSEIAESMGVIKEVRDAKNGSGFSFIDLAADHAGIRLVQESLKSQQMARVFQELLSEVESETDYMLDVKNLPESIELSQFKKSYEDTESDAYLKIENIIKNRIDELPIYKTEKIEKKL